MTQLDFRTSGIKAVLTGEQTHPPELFGTDVNANVRLKARAKAEQAVAELAKQYDAKAEFIWTAPTPASINDPKLIGQLAPVLSTAAGGNVDGALGYQVGPDDFSYFAREWPSIYYNLAVGETKGTNHSPYFDIGDEGILEIGVRAQALVAVHFLNGR